jgi:hypothetical protein
MSLISTGSISLDSTFKFWILQFIIVRLHSKEAYAMYVTYGRLLKVVKRGVYYMAVKWLYEHLFCICGKKDSVYICI